VFNVWRGKGSIIVVVASGCFVEDSSVTDFDVGVGDTVEVDVVWLVSDSSSVSQALMGVERAVEDVVSA
jgi:hypothetical protein